MTVESLPGDMVLPSRDTEIERYKRSYRVRVPGADTSNGSQVDAWARIAADMTAPLFAMAKVVGDNSVLERARGKALDAWADREGVDPKKEAFPASGYVSVVTSSGGGTIPAGDQAIEPNSGLLFEAIYPGSYTNGQTVAVVASTGGPSTNLAAGTKLRWVSPRPGISAECTVTSDGLTGGLTEETEADFLTRIQDEKRNKAASGNDTDYQSAAEKTPRVGVQKAFTYPAVLGASSTCLAFTLRPTRPGGPRIPNSVQIGLVEAHVSSQMPGDDSALYAGLVEQAAEVCYGITWNSDASIGWTDVAPWPAYYSRTPVSGPGALIVSAVSSATSFTIATANGNYTGVAAPVIGQTVGFYDKNNYRFSRKRILSFSGTGPWNITVDTANNVSDTGFVPAVNDRVMPWADDLDDLLPGIYAYTDTLGPGEQVAVFYDEGTGQRRQPKPPRLWPHTLTTRGLTDAVSSDLLEDVSVLHGDGVAPSVGTPGVTSNILRITAISFFQET